MQQELDQEEPAHKVDRIQPRPLSTEERDLLNFLLAQPFPGCNELRQQVGVVQVVEQCSVCPLITLSVPSASAPPAPGKLRVPVWATQVGPDGTPDLASTNILLHVVNGYMHELEFYGGNGRPVTHIPPLHSLHLFVDE